MSLDSVRRRMREPLPLVITEAPAGCGKTHEASALALDLASSLPEGREVLLLAHTNAAVQEFRERTASGSRVRAMTLDAFALELLTPYASVLDLPDPLRVGEEGIEFSQLSAKLCELFERAPAVAATVARHYPVVVLDEHQDTRTQQHRIVELNRPGFTGDSGC